ncbi:MAG: hypothetical protein CMP39_02495 [Rickettsiales bacterium]|nr:hypothetical protein [Rickettsiales bacterium]|tara:strand:- start:2393 stop:2926 length:534 start_codon:yes stop_codon:yes gene_type:complete
MKIKVGDKLDEIKLPTSEGNQFSTTEIKNKKLLLSFYRFASCPVCNLRLNQIVKRYDELGKNFAMVAIFHSSVEHLNAYTSRHKAPFPILADKEYKYFKKYDVKRSFLVFLLNQITRAPKIWAAMFKGYIPFRIKGYLGILPVDVLINEEGIVEKVKYGKNIADHMSFDEIKTFSTH